MKVIFIFALLISGLSSFSINKDEKEYYQITVYHFTTAAQEQVLDNYLEKALLPALHKNKFENIGVFKPLSNDTAADKTIYIFMHAKSINEFAAISGLLAKDSNYNNLSKEYREAVFNTAPFTRYETILLSAFPLALKMNLPVLKNPKTERIYELRSYESPTEALYRSKVKMFNEGGEIGLFKRIGSNAVFYADVLSGSRMPNLMYMTTYENMIEREAHWKAFFDSPEWKSIVGLPEYQHNVSRGENILMHATAYSDF